MLVVTDHIRQGRRIYKFTEPKVIFGAHIPEGFETDGGSIAWFGRALINPMGRGLNAFIVHDWMLVDGNTWSISNYVLNQNLKRCGISSWRRWLIMSAVNIRALWDRMHHDF